MLGDACTTGGGGAATRFLRRLALPLGCIGVVAGGVGVAGAAFRRLLVFPPVLRRLLPVLGGGAGGVGLERLDPVAVERRLLSLGLRGVRGF